MRSERNALARALILGLVWMSGLFVIDLVDSMHLVERALGRIRTDPQTTAMLRDAVQSYVLRAGVAYLAMGLWFGLGLGLAAPLIARRQRVVPAVLLASALTLGASFSQMVRFPSLQGGWWPWERAWVDVLSPGLFQLALGALVLAILVRAVHIRAGLPRVGALIAWAALTALWQHVPRPSVPTDNAGPNLLVIGVDGLRPDHLGALGYPRDTSPAMDAILAGATRFESAWSPLARTYPAWTSILTGTEPVTHRIRDNLPEPQALVPSVETLPRALQSAGVRTAFMTDDSRFSYMVPELGFDRIVQPPVGLEVFAIAANQPRFRALHGLFDNPLGHRLFPALANNGALSRSFDPQRFGAAAESLLAALSEHDRFAMFLHLCPLHVPGDRPHPYHQLYDQAGYEGPNRYRYSRSGSTWIDGDEALGLAPEDIAAQDERVYDAGVRLVDDIIAGLMAQLRAGGLEEDTIVVLLSDHGEEHWAEEMPYAFGGPNHGFHVYGEGQNRVLLALRVPGRGAAVVAEPVSLVDLAPTLADELGVELGPVDGRSLWDPDPERAIYYETGLSERRYWSGDHRSYSFSRLSERYEVDPSTGRIHIRPEFRPQLIAAKDRALVLGQWKLVWVAEEVGGRVKLFDREADPQNLNDLASTHPERVLELGARLAPYLLADGESVPEAWMR